MCIKHSKYICRTQKCLPRCGILDSSTTTALRCVLPVEQVSAVRDNCPLTCWDFSVGMKTFISQQLVALQGGCAELDCLGNGFIFSTAVIHCTWWVRILSEWYFTCKSILESSVEFIGWSVSSTEKYEVHVCVQHMDTDAFPYANCRLPASGKFLHWFSKLICQWGSSHGCLLPRMRKERDP